jgi:LysM repeat protein
VIHPYNPGETLEMIAARFGVTPVDIMNANPTLNLDSLARGTPIRIPRAPQPAPAGP